MKYPSSLRLHGPSIGNIDIGIYTSSPNTQKFLTCYLTSSWGGVVLADRRPNWLKS